VFLSLFFVIKITFSDIHQTTFSKFFSYDESVALIEANLCLFR